MSEAAQNPAKTKKSLRTAHVAVYDELLTNPDHTKAVLASNRKRIKNQDTAGYIPGTVFCTDDPTDSLYHMLADLAWSKSLDPAYHLRSASEIIENLDKSPEFIEAEKSFTGYYNMLWALFCNVKNGRRTFDCMLHRAAYVFVIAGSDITIDFGPEFQSPQALVQACSRRYPEAPYTKLSGLLKDLFIGNGFGWHEYLIPNLEAWKREQKQYGKQARSELFKGYHYHKALMKKDGDKFLKQSGIEHQAAVSPADNTEQTLISSSASEVCCPLPDARHPVLQAIDKASQGQLDRLLDGVIIKEEGGTAVLVCRNKFIADSLRRYEEIVESAVKASGFQSHAVRSADQPMTSILKPDNFIESSVEKNGTLRITTKPIPASLTDEAKKELTQRIRERVKEIETEHLQNWQQSRALAAVTD